MESLLSIAIMAKVELAHVLLRICFLLANLEELNRRSRFIIREDLLLIRMEWISLVKEGI